MSSRTPTFPPEVTSRAQRVLDEQARHIKSVRSAMIATADGFEVASVSAGDANGAKVAAMTSSLMAMGRAVGRELNYSGCRRMVFEADEGSVIVQPIEGPFPMLLCLMLDSGALLGQVLWSMGEITRQLKDTR